MGPTRRSTTPGTGATTGVPATAKMSLPACGRPPGRAYPKSSVKWRGPATGHFHVAPGTFSTLPIGITLGLEILFIETRVATVVRNFVAIVLSESPGLTV